MKTLFCPFIAQFTTWLGDVTRDKVRAIEARASRYTQEDRDRLEARVRRVEAECEALSAGDDQS